MALPEPEGYESGYAESHVSHAGHVEEADNPDDRVDEDEALRAKVEALEEKIKFYRKKKANASSGAPRPFNKGLDQPYPKDRCLNCGNIDKTHEKTKCICSICPKSITG